MRGLTVLLISLVAAGLVVFVGVRTITGQEPPPTPPTTANEFNQFLRQAPANDQSLSKDASGDGIEETYVLHNGQLTVTQANKVLWKSPPEWWVDHLAIAEATNDNHQNIILSVWKSGNFGPSKPFWVTENDPSVKNHLFIFEFRNGKIEPVWQSSNLSHPNCEFTFADINHDNQQELVVIEGEYNNKFACEGKYLAVWKWQDWGFYNEWRSEPGNYQNIESLLSSEILKNWEKTLI